MADTIDIASNIQGYIEGQLYRTLYDFEIMQICDVLDIAYPIEIQEKISRKDMINAINQDIKVADSVGMFVDEWYEVLIDEQERAGNAFSTFSRRLAFYQENKSEFPAQGE